MKTLKYWHYVFKAANLLNMSQLDAFRRTLEAGATFSNITRARAQEIVRDLIREGEMQRDQASKAVEALLEKSRKNSEELVASVRNEVRHQIGSLGLINREEVSQLVEKLVKKGKAATGSARKAAAKKVAAKKAAKKAVKKAAPAKKAPAKKAAAKKAAKKAVKKAAPAKKAAKKATKKAVKRAPAKKAAKRAPAKRS